MWARFGQADVYAEPFAGSLAVLLANPNPAPREVICDTDGALCNFWRALRTDPEAVAHWADWPTIHQDLTARHAWLRRWVQDHAHRLSEDPDYFDAKAAGWWVWGISIWIGGGWCALDVDQMPKMKDAQVGGGSEISRQRKNLPHEKRPYIHLDPGNGRGVSAQRGQMPKVCKDVGAGAGVSKQRSQMPTIFSSVGVQGVSEQRLTMPHGSALLPWFEALAARLQAVVVLNRDWTAALTPTVLADTRTGPGERATRCVFLDPPYATGNRSDSLYRSDLDATSDDVAAAAWQWAQEHGDRHRIAYCAHDGDVQAPPGWTVQTRAFGGPNTEAARRKRDAILFSPACLNDRQRPLFAAP